MTHVIQAAAVAKPGLPAFVADFEEGDFLFAPLYETQETVHMVLQGGCAPWNIGQIESTENDHLDADTVIVEGDVAQVFELLVVIRPGIHGTSAVAGIRERAGVFPIPPAAAAPGDFR